LTINCWIHDDGCARIEVRCDVYSLDAIAEFVAGLPWHSGQKDTYLLADFLKYLDEACQNSSSHPRTISVPQDLRLTLNMQLKAEIKGYNIGNVMGDEYRYHVWRTLVCLRLHHPIVTIYVDKKGRVVSSGDPVQAAIGDFKAQQDEV